MIKKGSEVKAGNTLANAIDGGYIGQLQSVAPYTGPLVDLLGEGTQIGKFFGGMQMTLPAVSRYRVLS